MTLDDKAPSDERPPKTGFPQYRIERDSDEYNAARVPVEELHATKDDPEDWFIDHTRYNWPYLRRRRRVPHKTIMMLEAHPDRAEGMHPDDVRKLRAAKRLQAKIESEGFNRGWAQCASQFGATIVELQGQFLASGLDEDASDADKRLAFAVMKDTLDRLMGKAKQTMEIEHTKSDAAPLSRLAELADSQPMIEGEIVDVEVEGDAPELRETWDE